MMAHPDIDLNENPYPLSKNEISFTCYHETAKEICLNNNEFFQLYLEFRGLHKVFTNLIVFVLKHKSLLMSTLQMRN